MGLDFGAILGISKPKTPVFKADPPPPPPPEPLTPPPAAADTGQERTADAAKAEEARRTRARSRRSTGVVTPQSSALTAQSILGVRS